MTSDTSPLPRPLFLPRVWLLSPLADTTLLVGGVLVSFALFALWRFGAVDTDQLVLLWVFGLHGPHFWATISRTYLDPTEWRQRGRLLLGSLGWFLVGPIAVGMAAWFGWSDLNKLFFFAAALWAYHHVVKQHFGFMALYRARAGEFDRSEFTRHKAYIVLSLWLPAVIALSGTDWLLSMPFVPTITAENSQTFLDVHGVLRTGCTIVFWLLQAMLAFEIVARWRRGRGVNVQEFAIAIAAVTLHWVVVRAVLDPRVGDPRSSYAFVPLVTIYHNIQYHALVWHYNRAKYQGPEARTRYGFAAVANRALWTYALLGVVYTVVSIGVDPNGANLLGLARSRFTELFAAGLWGFSFMHYYLDSKIWHVRQDDELRRVLGFTR